MKSKILIFQQMEPYTSKPFRLIENCETTDGIRSRICAGSWKTYKEAEEEAASRSAQILGGEG